MRARGWAALAGAGCAFAGGIAVLARRPAGPPVPDEATRRRYSGSPIGLEPKGRRNHVAGGSRVHGPRWEPAQLTALADWVPDEPVTLPGRVLARAWAAPMTVAGLAVGLGALAPPRVRAGVILFTPAGGVTGAVLRARGFSATALGHVVVSLEEPSPELFAHELVHVRQAERLGPFFAPLYVALIVAVGYSRHPLERAARLGARRSTYARAGVVRGGRTPAGEPGAEI